MEKLAFVVLTFLISAIIGWITIPRIVIIAKLKRLYDKPDSRKVHKGAIPRLGGISFFPGMLISASMMLGFRYYVGLALPLPTEVIFIQEFLFILSSMFILFFVGLADDLIGVGYRYKFAAQALAAVLIVFAGIIPTSLGGILGIYDVSFWVSVPIMILAIIFIVNAYNLIDGVDGLCSGLSSIALICIGSWFVFIDLYVYAMIAFGMLGVVLAFFKYNVTGQKLKVFMGDTGSLTLGFLIICLCLKIIEVSENNDLSPYYVLKNPIAIAVSIVFIPMFDTMRVFASRLTKGKSPFHADKTHIHHKLLAMGFSHINSTKILLVSQIFFIILNVTLSEIIALNINLILLIDVALAVSINMIINKRIATNLANSCK